MLRAVGHSDEADKVLKQFGMKTPVGGAIMEEGEEEEDEDDEPPQQPTGNGKAKAKAKAKAAASASNGKAKAQQGGSSPTRPVKIDDDCEDVD